MFECELCGKENKNKAGMKSHMRVCGAVPNPPAAPRVLEELPAPPSLPKEVVYRSPRIRALRIIVTPTFNRVIETPTGNYVTKVAGKTVEFKEGLYRTKDPEIISFLDGYTKSKAAHRYPIISSLEIERMGKCL
jgi:hypothetical protein